MLRRSRAMPVHYEQVLRQKASYLCLQTSATCQLSNGCCAMSNVLVSTTRLPNDPLTRLPFGGLVIAPSAFDIAQQAILQLTFVAGPYHSPLNIAPTSHFHLSSRLRLLNRKV